MVEIQVNVPIHSRDSDEFRSQYQRLRHEISDLVRVKEFCIHEAGHLIYFRRAHLAAFEFKGPTVYLKNGSIEIFPASVVPDERQLQRIGAKALAVGAAAGGAFTSIICRREYRGDAVDQALFSELVNPHELADLGLTRDELWEQAQREVEGDLRTMGKLFREEIDCTAAEIARECFGLDNL
jgi:hypothetical protein